MQIIIVKKGRKFIPIVVREADVEASLSRRAARLTGCTGAFARGTGARSIRALLQNDLEGFDSIRALKEAFCWDPDHGYTFTRRPEFDR